MNSILIIDDEPDAVAYISCLLEDHGYDVRSAHSAQRGFLLIEEQAPDLVLVDVMMPGDSGLKLIHQLRSRPDLAEIPVIMVTGHSEVLNDQGKSYLDHFSVKVPDAVLEKPFHPEQLLESVRSCLSGLSMKSP